MAKGVHGLGTWYAGVYGLACEPAHITDVMDFMPESEIEIGQPRSALHRADLALFHGLHIMLQIGRTIVESTELDLIAPIDELTRRIDEIAGTGKPAADDGSRTS